jgi:toxin ParE1/3/4
MAYRVSITVRAARDLAELYDDINAFDSAAARRWYTGLTRSILSLEAHPNRCPATPENQRLRHLLYGNKPHIFRVIYRVLERPRQVEILHIRHSATQNFEASDLEAGS